MNVIDISKDHTGDCNQVLEDTKDQCVDLLIIGDTGDGGIYIHGTQEYKKDQVFLMMEGLFSVMLSEILEDG